MNLKGQTCPCGANPPVDPTCCFLFPNPAKTLVTWVKMTYRCLTQSFLQDPSNNICSFPVFVFWDKWQSSLIQGFEGVSSKFPNVKTWATVARVGRPDVRWMFVSSKKLSKKILAHYRRTSGTPCLRDDRSKQIETKQAHVSGSHTHQTYSLIVMQLWNLIDCRVKHPQKRSHIGRRKFLGRSWGLMISPVAFLWRPVCSPRNTRSHASAWGWDFQTSPWQQVPSTQPQQRKAWKSRAHPLMSSAGLDVRYGLWGPKSS